MKRKEDSKHVEETTAMKLWRPELGSVLHAWHRGALNRPQRTQRRLLCLGHSPDTRDIESLVGPVSPQCSQMLGALQIPHLDSAIIPATGQHLPIGAHSERLDRALMPLMHRQALPALHVPPAHRPICLSLCVRRQASRLSPLASAPW